jgi:hypothetical protein
MSKNVRDQVEYRWVAQGDISAILTGVTPVSFSNGPQVQVLRR